jgi:hypothetical protein
MVEGQTYIHLNSSLGARHGVRRLGRRGTRGWRRAGDWCLAGRIDGAAAKSRLAGQIRRSQATWLRGGRGGSRAGSEGIGEQQSRGGERGAEQSKRAAKQRSSRAAEQRRLEVPRGGDALCLAKGRNQGRLRDCQRWSPRPCTGT